MWRRVLPLRSGVSLWRRVFLVIYFYWEGLDVRRTHSQNPKFRSIQASKPTDEVSPCLGFYVPTLILLLWLTVLSFNVICRRVVTLGRRVSPQWQVGCVVNGVALWRSVITLVTGFVCRTERSAPVPEHKNWWRVQARLSVTRSFCITALLTLSCGFRC